MWDRYRITGRFYVSMSTGKDPEILQKRCKKTLKLPQKTLILVRFCRFSTHLHPILQVLVLFVFGFVIFSRKPVR